MNYLSPQEMLFIHFQVTEEMEGIQGIKDLSIIKKLAKYVRNDDVFPDIFSKASALLFGIAKKRPFLDLNGATALMIIKVFLSLNQKNINIGSEEFIDFLNKELSSANIDKIKKIIIQNSASS